MTVNTKEREVLNMLFEVHSSYDYNTAMHNCRVANIAGRIALMLGSDNEFIRVVYKSGLLHDIGKIYIPLDILHSKAKLMDEEFKLIKNHPILGCKLLRKLGFREEIYNNVLQHHERLDGFGYPYGLKGKDILLGAKIIMVADVFDAMTSDRVYKKTYSIDDALNYLLSKQGKLYETAIVQCLCKVVNDKFNFKEIEEGK